MTFVAFVIGLVLWIVLATLVVHELLVWRRRRRASRRRS